MNRRIAKSLIAASAIALLAVIAGVYAQKNRSNVKSPSKESSLDTIRKAKVKSASPAEAARTRCLAKQQVRLSACSSKSGTEREVCEAVAKELIAVCNQIDPEASGYLASQLFSHKECAVRKCPDGGCPLPGGGVCVGSVCANEGAESNPGGILIDFHCTTSVDVLPFPPNPPKFCSCSSE